MEINSWRSSKREALVIMPILDQSELEYLIVFFFFYYFLVFSNNTMTFMIMCMYHRKVIK